MQGSYRPRLLEKELKESIASFPAVALLGPRQCGKSSLAHHILKTFPKSLYLDLERPSDYRKLSSPELFFNQHHDKLICLDEIQRVPELFAVLRSVIDQRKRDGQFLILGSASRDLIRQTSESLSGRLAYLELTPFLINEVQKKGSEPLPFINRGGFPRSTLAKNEKDSFRWRENFIRSFLERDIPQLGIQISAQSIQRLWQMLAHHHGQLLNQSSLGQALGVSHPTIRSYIELLSQTFMVRVLPPYKSNLSKRLIKSPKVYIRDTGVLNALLSIESVDDLLGHPIWGACWEGFVIETILTNCPGWKGTFYRTSAGAEIDLVLEKGRQRIGVECKASSAPQVSPGFWNALSDLKITQAWVIAPVKETYPLKKGVQVSSLQAFLKKTLAGVKSREG